MESLYKLKHADTQYKRVVVSHDLTKSEREREEYKKLVEEAKTRQAQDRSGGILVQGTRYPQQDEGLLLKVHWHFRNVFSSC